MNEPKPFDLSGCESTISILISESQMMLQKLALINFADSTIINSLQHIAKNNPDKQEPVYNAVIKHATAMYMRLITLRRLTEEIETIVGLTNITQIFDIPSVKQEAEKLSESFYKFIKLLCSEKKC